MLKTCFSLQVETWRCERGHGNGTSLEGLHIVCVYRSHVYVSHVLFMYIGFVNFPFQIVSLCIMYRIECLCLSCDI